MRRKLLSIALTLFFLIVYVGSSQALLLDASNLSSSHGLTVNPITTDSGDWFVSLEENFGDDSLFILDFSQQQGEDYSGYVYFEKEITNSTGMDWLDFHMALYVPNPTGAADYIPSSNFDGLYFTGITSLGPFSQYWYDANSDDELWLWDGVWADGATYTVLFSVDGWGWSGGSVTDFRLLQWPTDTGGPPVIPEPSTFILVGSGLAGLVFFARRRRKQ